MRMRVPVKVQLRQALARVIYLVVGDGDRQPEVPFARSAVAGAGCDRYARVAQQVVREGLGGEALRHAEPDIQAGFGLRGINAYGRERVAELVAPAGVNLVAGGYPR